MLQTMIGASRVFRVATTSRLQCVTKKTVRHSFVFLAAILFLFTLSSQASAQRGVTISYLADETASLDIQAVAAPEKAGEFKGYVPSFMAFSRLPDNFNGAVWLRITLSAPFEKDIPVLRVTLDTALPGVTRLFIPQASGAFTVMESPSPCGIFSLPENTPIPDTVYARIDGTPGLWFKPFLEPAGEKPLLLHFILAGLFGAAILLLLIQYARKSEEWRLWAAITAGCGIVAAILPPTPVAGAAYTPLMATAMLMPGLILVFFAHTTRHLFDSPRTMPGYDALLVLLYLVGGAIALLPLAPDFLWVSRYLPLAGVVLLPFLPVCMVAMARSLRGSSVYFCACLLPILGVAISAWELTGTGLPLVAGSGGLWGLALAILALACIAPAAVEDEAKTEEDVFDSLNRATSLSLQEDASTDDPGLPATAASFARTEETPTEETPADGIQHAVLPDMGSPDTGLPVQESLAAPLPPHQPEDEVPPLSLFGEFPEPAEPPMLPLAEQVTMRLPVPDSALLPLRDPSLAEESAVPEALPEISPAVPPQTPEIALPPVGKICPEEALPEEAIPVVPVPPVPKEPRTIQVVTITEDDPLDALPLPSPAPLFPERAYMTEAVKTMETEETASTPDDGDHETTRAPYGIIVADIAATSRARTVAIFDGTPYTVLECASPADAYALYARLPSAVVIMNADMPEVDIIAAIKDIHADDAAHGRSPAFCVVLVGYAAQAGRMLLAGCSRTVLKSQAEAELLPVVEECVPPPQVAPVAPVAPVAEEQAVSAVPTVEPETPEIRLNEALSDIPTVPAHGIFSSVLPPSPSAQPPMPTPAAPSFAATRADAARQSDGPELALLDMIITDEEEEAAGTAEPEPEPVPVPAPALTSEPEPAPQSPDPQTKNLKVSIKATPKPPVKRPAVSVGRQVPRPAVAPPVTAEQPAKAAAPATPMAAASAPASSAPISIPLPGEEDSIFKDMLPLIPGLLIELHDAMVDAVRGRMEKSPILVQGAAERVAGKAESFGLTRLERMARCVERAAAADDIEPMECVLADLENWVERYTEVLRKLHRDVQW